MKNKRGQRSPYKNKRGPPKREKKEKRKIKKERKERRCNATILFPHLCFKVAP
jgi:hypothetical protein